MSVQDPPPPPPARPPGASRYGWFIGVVVVLIMAYIAINTLRTNGPGASGPKPGARLHPFAAPLVLSGLDGDANVATKPHSGGAGAVPACSVHRPDAVNSCDLWAKGPLVLGFYFTRGAQCSGSFDVMQKLDARTPGVQFAGVIVRGDRGDARSVVRKHHWTFPIAYDRDGGIANLYGIAGCPEIVLAYPGGVVRKTIEGRDRAERRLESYVRALVSASVARGWKMPA